MGILYNSVKLQEKKKQEIVLKRLQELGVRESQQGQSIHDLDYEELKYELVLAEIRAVDVSSSENKWF